MTRRRNPLLPRTLNEIIRASITSTSELKTLCNALGFDPIIKLIDHITPQEYTSGQPIIANIDHEMAGGTHWVAIIGFPWGSFYFDPFGLPPARDNIAGIDNDNHMFWNDVQIQSTRSGGCGNYCALWLHYTLPEIGDGHEGDLPSKFFEEMDMHPLWVQEGFSSYSVL